ncbi:MAG: YidC/Oxa1 family insertase periplasmic-domain containing protein [Planctomycetota bacterium]|nr:YidC/Oxa1 family insertase periplasmic-domain containing protein [Planctomycetota bacterium]
MSDNAQKNEAKQRFILMMAVGLTFLAIMEFFIPPAPQREVRRDVIADTRPAVSVAPALSATPSAPVTTEDFAPTGDYTVVVRRGSAEVGGDGFEAAFSSIGASLSRYRLLGYYRLAGKENQNPGDEVILLDRVAAGRESLRIDAINSGPSRQEIVAQGLGDTRFQLIEVPGDAQIDPAPDESIRRGENLAFRAIVGDWELVKTFVFPKAGDPSFTIGMELAWRNLSRENRSLSYRLAGPAGMLPDDDSAQFSAMNFLTASQPSAASTNVEIERKTFGDVAGEKGMSSADSRGKLAWVGAKNRFFVSLLAASPDMVGNSFGAVRRLFPADPGMSPTQRDIAESLKRQPHVNVGRGDEPVFEDTSLEIAPGMIPPGGVYNAGYTFYAGPASTPLLEEVDDRFSGVISYTISYFDFISRWLVRLLNFLDRYLGNYGLAIILVTLIVRGIMHPLNRKSFVSMNRMQKLAPQMKELQKKYANDKVKMQQEVSKLYRDNKVSMTGGCLPMFIQLPIFFALYGAFSQGFSIRHAPFIPGWIVDLSKPDSVHDLGWNIPILQSPHISLLPILYLGLQYFQMSLQPKSGDPQQAQQQRMMKIMPLMFVFIFYAMPAGLVLYFAVSALFGVIENWWMRKFLFPRLGLGDAPGAAVPGAQETKSGVGAVEVKSSANKKKKRQ